MEILSILYLSILLLSYIVMLWQTSGKYNELWNEAKMKYEEQYLSFGSWGKKRTEGDMKTLSITMRLEKVTLTQGLYMKVHVFQYRRLWET